MAHDIRILSHVRGNPDTGVCRSLTVLALLYSTASAVDSRYAKHVLDINSRPTPDWLFSIPLLLAAFLDVSILLKPVHRPPQ
jgi:hypothetical protein